ncbi:MAG: hypothetical protein ACOX2S_08260 [bacterium]|jgi:hypothetical protein
MADLINFRLSKKANEVAEILATSGYFDFAVTAAKFALAYAIKYHFDEINPATYTPSDSDGSNYGIGSLDSDGQIAILLKAIYPDCTTPYLYARNLMVFGLLKIGERIENEGLKSISAFL